ncbi:Hypothetical predicted protein [Paramuricea clavata]|uniref:Uncharacterized protein n=1 Tax=Paramuricea clavata TaxID=317549 RepID=A0A6S7IGK4_PARCT|nr:Hypothetical predicted protein [Paramuricea clavata]
MENDKKVYLRQSRKRCLQAFRNDRNAEREMAEHRQLSTKNQNATNVDSSVESASDNPIDSIQNSVISSQSIEASK